MLVDALCDSTWANRSHRGWTAAISFGVQACALAGLLLLPLLFTQGLPRLLLLARVVAPSVPPGPPPAPAVHGHRPASSPTESALLTPTHIPLGIVHADEPDVEASPEMLSGSWVPGGMGPAGARNPVLDGFGAGLNPAPPPPPPPLVPHLRVSHMMEGNLIHLVQPVYPPLARAARIQGAVVLRAVISREGKVENPQVLSGHPMLVQAAVDAVRQWRYRPYYLNDQPVEVETQVTVNFILAGP